MHLTIVWDRVRPFLHYAFIGATQRTLDGMRIPVAFCLIQIIVFITAAKRMDIFWMRISIICWVKCIFFFGFNASLWLVHFRPLHQNAPKSHKSTFLWLDPNAKVLYTLAESHSSSALVFTVLSILADVSCVRVCKGFTLHGYVILSRSQHLWANTSDALVKTWKSRLDHFYGFYFVRPFEFQVLILGIGWPHRSCFVKNQAHVHIDH